jgi:hypothetical protein
VFLTWSIEQNAPPIDVRRGVQVHSFVGVTDVAPSLESDVLPPGYLACLDVYSRKV